MSDLANKPALQGQSPRPASPKRSPRAGRPKKWWGKYVKGRDGVPHYASLHWGRVLSAAGVACLAGYFLLTFAAWGYYSYCRKVPGIKWTDLVVVPRYEHVRAAIGASFFASARDLWDKKQFVQAIFTARAAVAEYPQNLDARLFLVKCWQQAGRSNEAIRTLTDGIEFNAKDPRLQKAALEVCLQTSHFDELLNLLHEAFPLNGVDLLDGRDLSYQMAEARSVLETSGPVAAFRVAATHAGLSDTPSAAPLFAEIDWELGKHESAFRRVQAALGRQPDDPGILDAYVDVALRTGRTDDARRMAERFLTAYPNLVAAQLRFIEAQAPVKGADHAVWDSGCMRFLMGHRHDPEALTRLASLSATKGWTDLAYLLYQNSLQDDLTGFPYAICYVGSLVKSGDLAAADAAWRDLSVRNSPQIASASYLTVMVKWGTGRESEATQVIDWLRGEYAGDPHKCRIIEEVFRSFGYPRVADEFAKGHS